MKKQTILFLAAALLLLPATAAAQHSSKAAEGKPGDSKSSKKAVALTGRVSLDGQTLVSEKDEIWTVDNAAVLTGLEGRQVVVKCQVLPSKNQIHVFSASTHIPDMKDAANRGDSAFRR
jgi:membrane protein implicated in regulation of membrane protease activity